MPVDTETDVKTIRGRGAAQAELTDGPEDISNGRTADLTTINGSPSSATVYVDTNGSVDLKLEFSPDGSNWFEPAEGSPVKYGSETTDLIFSEYDAEKIRITASNSTKVNLTLRVTA
ncbi:hypothetical protein EXE43_09580 [Halorubrum sp. SS5]|nr:hypothetical protein EXE43_09580 [Halorubrum sp. SS5]